MSAVKRFVSVFLIIMILCVQINCSVSAERVDPIANILGVYDGTYTATQGVTGLTLSIYRKDDLLNDDMLLNKLADVANKCGTGIAAEGIVYYTAADIRAVVADHPDEYIAIFNYFPVIQNPSVEEGMYTMRISYDEATGMYTMLGHQWLQRDTYNFADLYDVCAVPGMLTGAVYGEYANFFQMEYGEVGSFSVNNDAVITGSRIDFDYKSVSLDIGECVEINAVVTDDQGQLATEWTEIRWFSDDVNIAAVSGENWESRGMESASGVITGVSEGVTNVYAELENGRIAVCAVVVSSEKVAMPLEIDTLYEEITTASGQSNRNYRIKATVSNSDINPVTNAVITLNLPDNAELMDGEITHCVPEMAPNSTQVYTWEVAVEANENETVEALYMISAVSDQTEEMLEYKTIFVYPMEAKDNRLDFARDVWNFTNSNAYFKNGNYMTPEATEWIMNEANNIEREKISKDLDITPDEWNGSCFGMSVVCAFMKIGHLYPEDYASAAACLKEMPKPQESKAVYSLITYYQMIQNFEFYLSKKDECVSRPERERLIGLVASVEKVETGGMPVVIGIEYLTEDYDINDPNKINTAGHAMVAYDIEHGTYKVKDLVGNASTVYDKKIYIYDPNCNEGPTYMYINNDYSRWILIKDTNYNGLTDGWGNKGYCQNAVSDDGLIWNKYEGFFYYFDEPILLDRHNIEDSEMNYNARVVTNLNTELRIKAVYGDGRTTEFTTMGLNAVGADGNEVIAYVDGVYGDELSSGICYALAGDVVEIIIEPADDADVLDVEYQLGDAYYSVASDSFENAVFSAEKSVCVEVDGDYELTAVYNEGEYASEWYKYSVSGEAKGSISMEQNAEGYTIVSGDDLEDVTVTVKSHAGTQTKEVSAEGSSFMIAGADGELQIFADDDGDGVYDKELQTVEKKSDAKNMNVKAVVISILSAAAVLVVAILINAASGSKKNRPTNNNTPMQY